MEGEEKEDAEEEEEGEEEEEAAEGGEGEEEECTHTPPLKPKNLGARAIKILPPNEHRGGGRRPPI